MDEKYSEEPKTNPHTKDTPDVDEDEFEDFTDMLKELVEFNKHSIAFAFRELDTIRIDRYLKETIIDVQSEMIKAKVILKSRNALIEREKNYPNYQNELWLEKEKQYQREHSLKKRLSLLASGLTMQDLVSVSDEYRHILEDTYIPEGKEIREEVKEK